MNNEWIKIFMLIKMYLFIIDILFIILKFVSLANKFINWHISKDFTGKILLFISDCKNIMYYVKIGDL